MNESELRKQILSQRRGLSTEEVTSRSQTVVQRFLKNVAMPTEAWKGLRIGLYQALPSELSLRVLEQHWIQYQARLFYPRQRSSSSTRTLEFVEQGPSPAWQLGPYGIQEPHPDLPAMDPPELDLIVVPGVAFGRSGERLGMGAGFYDRFLARVPHLVRVVLSFEFQLLERLDQQIWDQPVDWIITETEEIRNERARSWLDQVKVQIQARSSTPPVRR